MRTIGLVLVALGVIALVYGAIDYSRDRTVLEIGSLNITATDGKEIPAAATVGIVVLIGGAAFLLVGKRRSSGS